MLNKVKSAFGGKQFFSLLSIFYLLSSFSFAQESKIDSLQNILHTAKADTHKVSLLNTFAYELRKKNPIQALQYAEEALELSEKLNYKKGIGLSYNNIGLAYVYQNLYDKGLEAYQKALIIREEIRDTSGIASSLNNIGNIYNSKGDYENAIRYFIRSLSIREKLGDQSAIGSSLNNIGMVYYLQNNYDKALEYQLQALAIREKSDDQNLIANSLNNVATVYTLQKNTSKALEYLHRALQIYEATGNKRDLADAVNNIGNLYFKVESYDSALVYFKKSLELKRQINETAGIATALSNMGIIYNIKGKYKQALSLLDESSFLAAQIGYKNILSNNYFQISHAYAKLNNYQRAYEYAELQSQIKDSLFNEESNKQITEMQTKYDTEKKEQQIKLLNKDKEIQAKDLQRQKTIRNSITGGLILVVLFSFVLINRLLLIRKQKKIIEGKNKNLEAANELISKQKEKITDSINYAKRIQEAILPAKQKIQETFPDSFILYKPRDIVSGDFYWFAKKDGVGAQHAVSLLAVADCTGHGVPGAFMSMIGNTNLNQIVNEKGFTEPAAILQQMHENIRLALKQDETDSQSRDGMDIALICLTPNPSPKERGEVSEGKSLSFGEGFRVRCEFAGAYRPLYILKKDKLEIEEIKANKFPVAGYHITKERKFTSHQIELSKGDTIYLFTDGYADQFGGPDGKTKMTTKRFKEKLLSIQNKTMQEQEKILDEVVEEWKGNTQQMDDVLVVGIRF